MTTFDGNDTGCFFLFTSCQISGEKTVFFISGFSSLFFVAFLPPDYAGILVLCFKFIVKKYKLDRLAGIGKPHFTKTFLFAQKGGFVDFNNPYYFPYEKHIN